MQLEFFEVPNPCIDICQSDNKGLCLGCFRTRKERQSWLDLSDNDKKKVIKRCIQRKRRKDIAIQAKPQIEAVNIDENDQPLSQPSLFDPPATNDINNSTTEDFIDFEL